MAKTPIGNTTTYLPVTEFLKRCDQRSVGDLVSDNENIRVQPAALQTDPNLAAALVDASGAFESAVFISQRYQLADFLALPNGSPAQGLMYQILTQITLKYLYKRRPAMTDPAVLSEADHWLVMLSEGKVIFGFEETADAGLLKSEHDTTHDVERRDGISVITRPFMGRRANLWRRHDLF